MQAEVAAGPTASTTPSAPRPFITSPGPGARNWSTSDAIDQAASLLEFQRRVLAEAGSDEELLVAEIDPADGARWREQFPVLADRVL